MKSTKPSPRRLSMDSEKAASSPHSVLSQPHGKHSKRTKGRRPVAPLQPDKVDDAVFEAEWKMTKSEEDEQLDIFLKKLKEAGALQLQHDRYTYRRFLRARQHDIKRATEMWLAHIRWRKESGADSLLTAFEFPERDAFISLYPQGYCNVDKMGRPVYIQHLGQLNMKKLYELTTEERMIKFHIKEYERCLRYIMPACSKAAGHHVDQTFAIIDLKGVGFTHVTGEIKKMLGKILAIDQDNFPEMLGHTCIINAGAVISFLFRFVKPMLDIRTQNKIEVCPKDYVPTLLNWISAENLPEYLGGRSKATLLDDAGPWNDPALVAEVDAEVKAGLPRLSMAASSAESITSGASPVAGASPKENGLRNLYTEAAEAAAPRSFPLGASDAEEGATLLPPDAAKLSRGPPLLAIRTTSIQSSVDGEYYSPRSPDSLTSGYFSAADSIATSSMGSFRGQGGASSAAAAYGGAAAAAAEGAEGSSDEGVEGKANGGLPADEPQEHRWGLASNQVPLLVRVRTLEERMLQLQGLAPHELVPAGGKLASREFGEGTVMARVDTLEQAVATLTRVQELSMRSREEQKVEPGCCSACSIM